MSNYDVCTPETNNKKKKANYCLRFNKYTKETNRLPWNTPMVMWKLDM